MTRIKDITFESGSLTGTNGADSTSGAGVAIDSNSVIKGTYSERCNTSANTGYVTEDFTAVDTLYVSVYIKIATMPAGNVPILQLRTQSGTNLASLQIRSTSRLRLLDVGNTAIGSDIVITTGVIYRLGIRYTKGTGANAIIQGFIALDTNPFTEPFAATTSSTNTLQVDRIRAGVTSADTIDVYIDNIRVDDTSMPTDDVATPTNIFSDDFETNNLSNWTGTNGTIATGTTYALAGTYGAHAASTDAYAYKDFTAPTNKFSSLSAKVKIVTASGTGIFRIIQISDGPTAMARIIYDNGSYKLWLYTSDFGSVTATISGITTNTLQTLRLDFDYTGIGPVNVNGGNIYFASAYVDGILAATIYNNGFANVVRVASRVFILSYEDAASTTADVYFDDVKVYNGIAPTGGGPTTYNQTISATITITVTEVIQATKTISASVSNTITTLKQATKTVSTSVSNVVSFIKQATKSISATATGDTTLTKQANKSISAAVSNTITMGRDTSKVITAGIITTITYTKHISKEIITGMAGIVAIGKGYLREINVSISSTVSIGNAFVETVIKGIRNVASIALRLIDSATIGVRTKDNDEL